MSNQEQYEILPKGENIYIEVDDKADKKGLVFIPENASQRARTAEVKAIGDEVKQYLVGDRVLISWYAGIHIQLPQFMGTEEKHRIIREGEILAAVK